MTDRRPHLIDPNDPAGVALWIDDGDGQPAYWVCTGFELADGAGVDLTGWIPLRPAGWADLLGAAPGIDLLGDHTAPAALPDPPASTVDTNLKDQSPAADEDPGEDAAPAPERFPHVAGRCPMGCGETLSLYQGYVTCRRLDCPDPAAASTILSDRETEHTVAFTPANFTIRHPLRERIGDQLLLCGLHTYLRSTFPPVGENAFRDLLIGSRYRARQAGDGWAFAKLDDEPATP